MRLASVSTSETSTLFAILAMLIVGALLLGLIGRRRGGPPGGSEKESVAAWYLIAAIVLGMFLVDR